jgi:hypothetical protein
MGEKSNAYRILVGKPEGKRPRCKWEDNIKMGLRETAWRGKDWIDLAQDRYQWRVLVNTVMNLRNPHNVEKFLSSCTASGFSRRAQLHGVSGRELIEVLSRYYSGGTEESHDNPQSG